MSTDLGIILFGYFIRTVDVGQYWVCVMNMLQHCSVTRMSGRAVVKGRVHLRFLEKGGCFKECNSCMKGPHTQHALRMTKGRGEDKNA